MFSSVRRVLDWLRAKPALVLAVTVFFCASASYGQEKFETARQTNDKIEQLALDAHNHPAETQIGAGDTIHVDVFEVPELSRDVRVDGAGDVGYPLIPGRIHVAGLTPLELERKMEQLLIENGLVSHPQVSVFVKEETSQPVSVMGAVRSPRVYQVSRPTTLLEVLAAAGGIADGAGSTVTVMRPVPLATTGAEAGAATSTAAPGTPGAPGTQQSQQFTIRLKDLLESGDPSYNIQVYGGDIVSVPAAGIIYVAGAGVQSPGGYVLQNHGAQVTVLKAVALAHGLSVYAKADDAVIMRDDPDTGQREEIPVHIKKIEKNRAEDMPLRANDILYIPDSTGKKVLAKGAEAALGITTGLVIYRAGNGNL
ncbi:MAG: polysaccharide biosynthesis/export family protein [Candidatus Acidiferrales bacterium]